MKVYKSEMRENFLPSADAEFVLKSDHEAAMALKDLEIRLLREQRNKWAKERIGEDAVDEWIKKFTDKDDKQIQSALQRLAKG